MIYLLLRKAASIILFLFTSSVYAADVYVLNFEGTVRYKHPHKTFWYTLFPSAQLYFGDILYIYPGSSVTIRYPSKSATVKIEHNGFFVITPEVPQLKYYERVFNRSTTGKKQKDPKKNTHLSPFLRHITPSEKPDEDKSKKVDEIKNSSLNVKRDLLPMRWADPRAPVKVVTEKLPTFANFSVEPKEDSGLLWGYLWYEKKTSPVWVGLSFETFRKVRLPFFGNYILQVISEEESYATPPLKITVEKGKTPTINHDWSDGEVLLLP